ncbi:MAG: MBL fold metallo-hydrolase, partial [Actinomycetota bacterium]
MTVTVTVIGSAGTHSSAQRVCSAYLVTHEGTDLLLDVGSGALHNLLKVRDVADLDGLVISHMHPDHYMDVFGLNYALRFHPSDLPAIPVFGPADMYPVVSNTLPEESVEKMADLLHFHTARAGDRVHVKPYVVAESVRLGDDTSMDVEAIPTGNLLIDRALGVGGFPRGRVVEIFGPESSGKTT